MGAEKRRRKVSKEPDGAANTGAETVVGIALWATVSDAVDAKITEQIKAGVFPVRLGTDEWTSGETVWLLDVVVHDRQQAPSVLASFRQLAGAVVSQVTTGVPAEFPEAQGSG